MFFLTEPAPIPDHIPTTTSRHPAAVYTVRDVAALLRCSNQHVLDLIGRERTAGDGCVVLDVERLRTWRGPAADGTDEAGYRKDGQRRPDRSP